VASDAIAKQRSFLFTLQTPNQLNWIIDMSEMYLRLTTKDWQRAIEVIQRMPEIELVRQIKLNIINKQDPKKIPALVAALPENTVRQQINKFLSEANMNIDQENIALKSLNKALEIGAENGYFEYFIRQTALYPLMVKAAAAKPTIYLEELVNAMTKRIHEINNDSGEIAEKLTQRELEILKHLTTGNPISSIAKSLHISQNTMKTHLRNTYRKLDADGRYTAVEKAMKLLLI
jgi:DNA-binding NarL/FixJ family response regulator